MKGLVFITLFLLTLFANTIESRHKPGDHHWRIVTMGDESLHEAIKDLIHSDPSSLLLEKKMADDCIETLKPEYGKFFVKDIEPRPSATFYPRGTKTKLFAKDIEPRPSASFYPDNTKTKFFAKDIEPRRPSASFYSDDTKTKLFVKDIEPRPSASFYPDDTKAKLFAKDIEPRRPSASFYPDVPKTKFYIKDVESQPNILDDIQIKRVKDIEPQPSVTFYQDNLKAKELSAGARQGEPDIQVAQA